VTSNQTFAGTIAAWLHDTFERQRCVEVDPAGNTYEVDTIHKDDCRRCEAQAIETRLRGLMHYLRDGGGVKNCWRCRSEILLCSEHKAKRDAADALDAILGPEQAGERTSR
jgi:hypothetical protein